MSHEPGNIGIREAARRIGVSDTALHKAIKAGRCHVVAHTPTSNRPLVAWPQVLADWKANTDPMKRSHVGPAGAKQVGTAHPSGFGVNSEGGDPGGDAPQAATGRRQAAKSGKAASSSPPADEEPPARAAGGPTYQQSRTARETYAAALLRIELQEKRGEVVAVDLVRTEAFKVHRAIRDKMLALPDRCSAKLAGMTDAGEVHAYLLTEVNAALRALASDIYAPAPT